MENNTTVIQVSVKYCTLCKQEVMIKISHENCIDCINLSDKIKK